MANIMRDKLSLVIKAPTFNLDLYFCSTIRLLYFVLFLSAFLSALTFAQESIQQAQGIIDEAEAIWKDRSYPTWSNERLNQGIKNIDRLISSLESIRNLDTSIEWRSAISQTISNLRLRRGAYDLLYRGEKLPGNKAKVNECLDMLDKYVADTTRSMFTVDANPTRKLVERTFLLRFADCLETISDDDSAFGLAAALLKDAVLPPPTIAEALRRNPNLIKLFLKNWKSLSDSTTLAITESVAEWVRTDSLAARRFWEAAIKTDLRSAIQMMRPLLLQIQKSPQSIAVWQAFVETFPFDQVDREYLETISKYAQSIQDRRWAIAILDTLVETAPPPELQTKEAAFKYYERLAKDKFRREDILFFLEKAQVINRQPDAQPPVLVVNSILYDGPNSDILPETHYQTFANSFQHAFDNAFEVIISKLALEEASVDEIIRESDKYGRMEFMAAPSIPASLRNRPALALVGAYSYREDSGELKLYCRIADAKDGIVLSTKSTILNTRFETYENDVMAFAKALAEALESEIADAVTLEELLQKPLPSWTPEKIKAALYYGLSFGVERSPEWDALPLRTIERIEIKEPFWDQAPRSPGPNSFLQHLKNEVATGYAANVNPEFKSQSEPLVLSGRVASETPILLEIFMTARLSSNTLNPPDSLATIDLQFVQTGDELSALEVQRAVDVVMMNLAALIPKKTPVPPPPHPPATLKEISCWNSVPSLFYAGTSQLIIADRMEDSSISSQKHWGWGFLALETALLGGALYFDRQAIDNVNNEDLQVRNKLLICAGTLGLVSALKAWFNIGNHNSRLLSASK